VVLDVLLVAPKVANPIRVSVVLDARTYSGQNPSNSPARGEKGLVIAAKWPPDI
jgi:hypothetical protein